MSSFPLLLDGLRVIDAGDAVGQVAARYLADLGAETILLEPTGGSPLRGEEPVHDGHSLPFAVRNANKISVQVDADSPEGREQVRSLLTGADIAFLTVEVAEAVDLAVVTQAAPHLVVVVSSPFGSDGPRAGWQATDRTLLALSGAMSRSGRPGDVPLLPPDGIASATAAAQAAWTALTAYVAGRAGGEGQVIDLAHHEAVVTGLDPAFGVQGSAAAGRSGSFRRGRPPANSYPIYPCADGFVRLCLLAKRQWRGMFGWLGEPEEFADPKFDSIAARVEAGDRLDELIVALFADQRGADLVEEAARRGVPLAQVLTLGEATASDHFLRSGAVADTDIAPGVTARVPVGSIQVDGVRLGWRTPAPGAGSGEATHRVVDVACQTKARSPRAPYAGLRVLDLGVIVFGAEVGRAFADLGADVIKVESLAFPDGLRQTRGGEAMNASFAWGNRNKRSLGLDLRSPEGKDLFLQLADQSDVVLSNFKPGTLDSLGIGYDVLAARNAGIVVLESAAFSSNGPWARRLGYGPLVRASVGVTSLWKYDADDTESWDGVTIYPDHVAAKVGALAVAAALVDRARSGRGHRVEVAQSDVVLHQLAALAVQESLVPGTARAVGNRGRALFGGIFPCAGDDEWVVLDARDPAEVAALEALVASAAGDDEEVLAKAVAAWTEQRKPAEAAEVLQSAGLPAAPMLRLPELLEDAQLTHRGTYRSLVHPLIPDPLPSENTASPYADLTESDPTPAPLPGQHTRVIATEVLGLDDATIDRLLARGVLHEGGTTS
ncbi:CoA transferase [Nocardioides sp. SYSU DS0651]|uniref:CaiB/BaiF CoA-transferase family protein n=1 Tax=Nocardioides sp. SYSU DS0651 TaxID=3415955 RepID=UPI003F4BF1EF